MRRTTYDGRDRAAGPSPKRTRRAATSSSARADPVSSLHRSAGNQAVQSSIENERERRATGGSAPGTAGTVDRPATASGTNEGRTADDGPSAPAADLCPRCTRRFEAGKPLNCPACESELAGEGRSPPNGAPSPDPEISVKRFSPILSPASTAVGLSSAAGPDKSVRYSEEEDQDQTTAVSTYSTTASGVHMEVQGQGLGSDPNYPDGWRWTQTIDTNEPLGGGSSPYVDPRPNDDTKPFYWTDAEHQTHLGEFIDYPSRSTPASGQTTWDATLCLNGVNGTDVTAFDCLSYGFTVDSSGSVTKHGLTSTTASGTHRSTLSSSFPGWTFR